MLNKLCQYSNLPVLILDSSGCAVKVNQAFQSYWNADPDKVLGSPPYNAFEDAIFHQRDATTCLREALKGLPVQLEPMDYRLPLSYCRKGARVSGPRELSIFAIPLPNPPGDNLLALFYYDESMCASLSFLERRCDQLMTLTESVLELKHEINNPLLLIIGHAQLLMAKSDNLPGDVVRKLEKILGAAEKIRNIVAQHEQLSGALAEGES
jgi:nitrogen-specific signal transduction histidine kinase